MTNTPQEPSADARQFARFLRDWYLALIQEGFGAGEALQIIGVILAAQIGGAK